MMLSAMLGKNCMKTRMLDNNSQLCYTVFTELDNTELVMKVSDLTSQQLYSMLCDLQTLVDGNFLNAHDIVDYTGVGTFQAAEILDSINLLKSLTLK